MFTMVVVFCSAISFLIHTIVNKAKSGQRDQWSAMPHDSAKKFAIVYKMAKSFLSQLQTFLLDVSGQRKTVIRCLLVL